MDLFSKLLMFFVLFILLFAWLMVVLFDLYVEKLITSVWCGDDKNIKSNANFVFCFSQKVFFSWNRYKFHLYTFIAITIIYYTKVFKISIVLWIIKCNWMENKSTGFRYLIKWIFFMFTKWSRNFWHINLLFF